MKTSKPRNAIALMMIVSGVGRKQVFRDRRLRRAKDRERKALREET